MRERGARAGRARRRHLAPLVLLLAGTLVLGSCTSKSTGSSGSNGGLLRLGTIDTIVTLNPFITQDTLSFAFYAAIYPKLVQYNLKTLDFEPAFASSWTRSSDGRVWTFTTRPHATWSDGAPLTAADAAWTIATMIKYRNGAAATWASAVAGIVSVKAVSPTTLVVSYGTAVSNSLSELEQIPILPEHIWKVYAVGNGRQLTRVRDVPTASSPLVCGGPFIMTRYVQGQVALFKRNPHYYATPAHIAGFGVEFFSNDDAQVAAMKAGELDGALGNPNIPPTDVKPLKAAGFTITSPPASALNDFIINTNPKKTVHRELLNPLVREAFEYATDRTTIDRVAFLGYATPGGSLVPPVTGKWSDPSIHPLPYNLAKAAQLLNEAGDRMGPNGVRIANGHPMSYTVLLSPDNGGAGVRTGEIMTADFLKIGVQLNFRTVDDSTMSTEIAANNYRTFDLAMWGWDTYVDPSFILSVVLCSQYGNYSDSGYCNPTYDKLYAQQAAETNDAKRLKIVYEMQQMLFNDRPYIILQYLDVIEAWSKHWSTPLISPDGFLSFYSSDPLTQIHQVS